MIIVGGTATNGIDESLSKHIRAQLIKVEHKIFPDGESYIRIPQRISDQDVYVVQSLYPPQDKHFVELLLILETLSDMKNNKITAIIPYLAYARQDRRFKEGEAVSIKSILNAIQRAGATSLIVIEPHKEEELSYFNGEVKTADPSPEIAKEIIKRAENPFVLAPDRGAIRRAKRLAEELNAEYSYIEKERDRDTGEVRIKSLPDVKVKGKDVVLIDDIISTGSTMIHAAKASYELGARKVIAASYHALFIEDAYQRMINNGIKEIITTNTIPQDPTKLTIVDVSPAIARKI